MHSFIRQQARPRAVLAVVLAVWGLSAAQAHTVWFEPQGGADQYRVMFGGHQGVTETYAPEKLRETRAWSVKGEKLDVQRSVGGVADGVWITAPGAALLSATFDNGYWSKGADGKSHNVPMDALPGAVSGVHAVKFHKLIAAWSPAIVRPIGQAFELTPVEAVAPRAGQPFALRVLIDGRPAAGIALAFGEEGREAMTDADGVATLTARSGRNRIWAGQRLAVDKDPRMTQRSIEYSLVFDAK